MADQKTPVPLFLLLFRGDPAPRHDVHSAPLAAMTVLVRLVSALSAAGWWALTAFAATTIRNVRRNRLQAIELLKGAIPDRSPKQEMAEGVGEIVPRSRGLPLARSGGRHQDRLEDGPGQAVAWNSTRPGDRSQGWFECERLR
jgi:hypothetical protein